MSAFYDQASLVVVPSGYKSGKIYAQKPLTTDGQLTFTRASTATRVTSTGTLETVASGVPRLDYSGGATCPKILLEPQRSNVCPPLNLHQFSAATYTSGQADPFNGTNAYAWREDTTTAQHYGFTQQGTTLAVGNQNFSVYVKPVNNTNLALTWNSPNAQNFGSCIFNFSTKTFSAVNAVNTQYEELSGNWWRISFTISVSVAGIYNVYYNTLANYAGNTSKGYDFFGFQIEAGSYPTSLIPTTTTAAVTRLEDLALKTGISSIIGQTEGTIYWEVSNISQHGGNGARLFSYTDGNNFILINPYGTTLRILILSSGTAFDNFISISGDSLKIAVAYKANDYKFYVNGASVGTPVATSVPAMSALGITDYLGTGVSSQSKTSQLLLFKTRLTNAQLAELTTL
jgi:hypothetical protein